MHENIFRFASSTVRFCSASCTSSVNLACVHTCHVRHAWKKMRLHVQNRPRHKGKESTGCFCVLNRWLSPLFALLLLILPLLAFLSISFMSRRLNVRRIKYSRLNMSLSLRRNPILSIFLYFRFTIYLFLFLTVYRYIWFISV